MYYINVQKNNLLEIRKNHQEKKEDKKVTNKGRVLWQIRGMSSGTIANLIGSTKYLVIDRAADIAAMYVIENLSEADCEQVQTFEDLCEMFLKANRKERKGSQ